MFELAIKHRKGSPLGFGAMLIVYPLIVTENISQEVYQETKQYCQKHFAANEFPCVIDLATGYVYYYEQTPLWGSAYYAGIRKDAYRSFLPKHGKQSGKLLRDNKITISYTLPLLSGEGDGLPAAGRRVRSKKSCSKNLFRTAS